MSWNPREKDSVLGHNTPQKELIDIPKEAPKEVPIVQEAPKETPKEAPKAGADFKTPAIKGIWPNDNYKSLVAFYTRHELGPDGNPTARWESNFLIAIDTAYPMNLSWEPDNRIQKIRCHEAVAPSLRRILGNILAYYEGDMEKLRAERMHLYGGCYNFRRTRGGSNLSTHAWGAAIDLDPDKNPLGAKWEKGKGMMPEAVIEIFKAEGWTWGGDWKSRPDCMHFQAANA